MDLIFPFLWYLRTCLYVVGQLSSVMITDKYIQTAYSTSYTFSAGTMRNNRSLVYTISVLFYAIRTRRQMHFPPTYSSVVAAAGLLRYLNPLFCVMLRIYHC